MKAKKILNTLCCVGILVMVVQCSGSTNSSSGGTIVVNMPPAAGAKTLEVPSQYPTIEAAISAAARGDRVLVDSGTYTPAGGRLVINKEINVLAEPSLDVKPVIVTNYAGWTDCAVQIAADNVRFEGFEVDNQAAGDLAGYIIGDYDNPMDGWAVRNCDVHDGRNAIRIVGDNVTIEYNHLHKTSSDLINCGYGDCFGLKVMHNWLHSDNPLSGGKPACLTYSCSSSKGDDVEISYNYCWASRTFVDFQNQGDGLAPANAITVRHNTVDFWMGDLPDPVTEDDAGQQMSIAWWADSGNWNGPNFNIRDNLFTRQKWYQVVDTDTLLEGEVVLLNNMFWEWYLLDAWYPSEASPNEWPGKRGAVGWEDMGPGNEFVMKGCISGKDPLYQATGTTPDTYYALQSNSPAIKAATDKTNIGAWQGAGPEITKVRPACAKAGKTVGIFGSGLLDVEEVYFDKLPAQIEKQKSDTKIQVIVPQGPDGEEVDVTVISPKGSDILVDGFRYPDNGKCGVSD